VPKEPHFPFHALVQTLTPAGLYDPTYGVSGQPAFLEAVDVNSRPFTFLSGNTFAILARTNFTDAERQVDTELSCPHPQEAE
jgi:hypothetical protein